MDGWGGLHLHRGGVVPRLSPFVRRSMEPSMQAIRLLLATCFIGLIAATAFASDLPREADLARNGLKMAWWGRAAIDPRREKVDFVTNDEDMVFIRSTTGIITAFEIETGKRVWSTLVGRPNQQAFRPESNSKRTAVHKTTPPSAFGTTIPPTTRRERCHGRFSKTSECPIGSLPTTVLGCSRGCSPSPHRKTSSTSSFAILNQP